MTGSSNELDSGEKPFGLIHPVHRAPFGDIKSGTIGGGFGALLENVDRDRGFLSKADREFLLETRNLDLSDTSQRNARTRVRNRILSVYLDSRYLQYLSDRDRSLVFQNARNAGFDLHFRHGFKEFVRFAYLGLLEDDSQIDITEILEEAIREAEQEHATKSEENVNVEVDIDITHIPGDNISELERRYTQHDQLERKELEVLVNTEHTNDDEDIADAADIDLIDAIYYDARQPKQTTLGADRGGYTWEDPDRKEAEEIVDWLRSVFDEYDVGSYDELEELIDWGSYFDEEFGSELRQRLNRLPRVAAYFPTQMALSASLAEEDMNLLHEILWNPDNVDVEDALEQVTRPPTADKNWSPAEDEYVQRFIARVEVAREASAIFTSGGENGKERWEKILHITDFDKKKWAEYMHEQRAKWIKYKINEEFDLSDELSTEEVLNLDAFERKKMAIRERLDLEHLVNCHGEKAFSEGVKQFLLEWGDPT